MIYNYEVINPVTNNKKPFYDHKRKLFLFHVDANYKYYVECARNNETTGSREYFILLSEHKFDENCRKCSVDDYGRCRINVKGEIKEYILREIGCRGNVEVNYISHEYTYDNEYDVYEVV